MDHNNQFIFDVSMSLAYEGVVKTICMTRTTHIFMVDQSHSLKHQIGIIISVMNTTSQG